MDTNQHGQVVPLEPQAQGLSSRALLLRKASQRTPTTAEDLPIGFYRVDLLPINQPDIEEVPESAESTDDTQEGQGPDAKQTRAANKQLEEVQALQAAYIELSYEHGYPTIPTGEPFWHKLDYEPGLAYSLFQTYLEQDIQGGRDLSALAEDEEFLKVFAASRGQAEATKSEALAELNEFFILYYWRPRAKAHDIYKEAAYRHMRMKRAMSAEDHHYTLAGKALEAVETYLLSEDFGKGLTPRHALDALTKLVAIQRISAGLPAAGPLAAKDVPQSTQFEGILRQIGIQAAQQQGEGLGPDSMHGKSQVLDKIMRDPHTVKQMQELIIRVTTTSHTPDQQNRPGRTFNQNLDDSDDDDDGLAEDIEFHKL